MAYIAGRYRIVAMAGGCLFLFGFSFSCKTDIGKTNNENIFQENKPQNALQKPAIECPFGTQLMGKPPPIRRELLSPEKRTQVPGVECTESRRQANWACWNRLAKDGYKQWCARPDGTWHGPSIGWDRIGHRRVSVAYVDGKMVGLFVVWDHFGEIKEIATLGSEHQKEKIWSFNKNRIYWTHWRENREIDGTWHMDSGEGFVEISGKKVRYLYARPDDSEKGFP